MKTYLLPCIGLVLILFSKSFVRADPGTVQSDGLMVYKQLFEKFWSENHDQIFGPHTRVVSSKLKSIARTKGASNDMMPVAVTLMLIDKDGNVIREETFGLIANTDKWVYGDNFRHLHMAQMMKDRNPEHAKDQVALIFFNDAITVYKDKHGKFPAKLDDLVPEELEEIPQNRSTGSVFRYLPDVGKVVLSSRSDLLNIDRSSLRTMRDMIKVYHAREKKLPRQLKDLLPDYLAHLPVAQVPGASFQYDPKTGTVVHMYEQGKLGDTHAAAKADRYNLDALKAALAIYQMRNKSYPKQLEDLSEDYILSIPKAQVPGASFRYDPKTGEVSVVDQK